jgi:hypothetical protein
MTDHPDEHSHGHSHGDVSQEDPPKMTGRRLLLTVAFVLAFGALAFGLPTLGRNAAELFIPVWLILTVSTVFVIMWFTKRILTAERARDPEPLN